jgi:peptidylprolyl isomerase
MIKNIRKNGIQLNDIITIEYTARMNNGITVMSTANDGPLTFKVGTFPLVKGFNDVVLGMKVGEQKSVIIPAKDAFGPFDHELICKVSLSELPEYVRVGQRIVDIDDTYFNVLEVNNDEGLATLDGNHFLAGQDLAFSIRILNAQIPPDSAHVKMTKRNVHKDLKKRFIGIPKFN